MKGENMQEAVTIYVELNPGLTYDVALKDAKAIFDETIYEWLGEEPTCVIVQSERENNQLVFHFDFELF
jgi:hypothetical protein